ncbi:MAG: Sec63 [Piccolia ochrophora]|nr:MAG: Sec63 [Piccolia ochrophora]
MDPGLDAFDRALLDHQLPHSVPRWSAINPGYMVRGSGEPSAPELNEYQPHTKSTQQRPSLGQVTANQRARTVRASPGQDRRQDYPLHDLESSPSKSKSLRRNQNEILHDVRPSQRCQSFNGNGLDLHPVAGPIVHGINLVFTHQLPDRFRSIFPFEIFNPVQSKCFELVYSTDENVVVAAPTASGKTSILELAICRLLLSSRHDQFKIVYQAPTKSLCSERFRDWQAKFGPLKLPCAELTGDTGFSELREVQNASIIITTPEKWDSVTRKWKDHAKLMQLVKLFLIDEVHTLKDIRGATLEAVVSRMKSVGSNVRFIALSATVPNVEDIAAWLGRDPVSQHLPANYQKFGEEFRPVQLQKFVCGYNSSGNDFAFDKFCDSKLSEVISKYSSQKPIMVFCCTRNSSISTAKILSKMWATAAPRDRHWPSPSQALTFQDDELCACTKSGVAFHHAGLDIADRRMVEKSYLEGQLGVICCTSTLAVGVNLPCYLVIIKNTVTWQTNGLKEYADIEIMQMLGRAGRPQFDQSAVAVIMTRSEKADHYQKMVSGKETLESCLHLNLIEHLNAEIGLGTVTDLSSGKRWLKGTFLSVRLLRNPDHYRLEGETDCRNIDERLEQICDRDIALLRENQLVSGEDRLHCTDFGDAMTRYYVKFETMQLFLELENKARMSEILSTLSQAAEFKDIRLKAAEKALYRELNKANGIKFPIKVDIALAAHKVSLIVQAELGGVDFPTGQQFQKHRQQQHMERGIVFHHLPRLVRCIVDCQLQKKDSFTVRHALDLARSFAAKAWDNSALQLKQIDGIGPVAVRKFVAAGVNTIEALEDTEPHRIEMVLSRHPPFGTHLLARLKEFPKLRVSAKVDRKTARAGEPVKVDIVGQIGFMNEKPPLFYCRQPLYICYLAETSDGQLLDFGRLSARKLGRETEIIFSAPLINATQLIRVYVMCEEIAGSMRYVELKPEISLFLFPPTVKEHLPEPPKKLNIAKANSFQLNGFQSARAVQEGYDNEFDDDALEDGDLQAAVGDLDFSHIDDFTEKSATITRSNTSINQCAAVQNPERDAGAPSEPMQLANDRWHCNHKCKDKSKCKHMCCRDGLDRPPKTSKTPAAPPNVARQKIGVEASKGKQNARVQLGHTPKHSVRSGSTPKSNIETVDLIKERKSPTVHRPAVDQYHKLDKLHSNVQDQISTPFSRKIKPAWPSSTTKGAESAQTKDITGSSSSQLPPVVRRDQPNAELLTPPTFDNERPQRNDLTARNGIPSDDANTSRYDDALSELEDGLVGLDDSVTLQCARTSSDVDKDLPLIPYDLAAVKCYGVGRKTWSSSPTPANRTIGLPSNAKRKGHTVDREDHYRTMFFHNTSSDISLGDGNILSNNSQPKRRAESHTDTGRLKSPRLELTDTAPKRSRLFSSISQAPQLVNSHQQISQLCTNPMSDPKVTDDTSKLPLDTDGIDPALLAEYGEFVDFY